MIGLKQTKSLLLDVLQHFCKFYNVGKNNRGPKLVKLINIAEETIV